MGITGRPGQVPKHKQMPNANGWTSGSRSGLIGGNGMPDSKVRRKTRLKLVAMSKLVHRFLHWESNVAVTAEWLPATRRPAPNQSKVLLVVRRRRSRSSVMRVPVRVPLRAFGVSHLLCHVFWMHLLVDG